MAPARRSEPISVQLFASSPSDPRSRRPVDSVRAVGYLLVLTLVTLLSEIGKDLDREISEALTDFPGFLKVLWLGGFWLAQAWAVTLLVICLVRRRFLLALEGLLGAFLALGIAVAIAAILSGEPGDVVSRLVDSDGPPVFPPAVLGMTTAVLAVMAPYLVLPARRFGRALLIAQLVGSVFLGVGQGLGVLASLALGLLAGTALHLVAGSPGGFPTVTRVKEALADLGVTSDHLAPTVMRREGVAVLVGADEGGPLEVRVYGRDAWEGELLADLWRRAWYRGRRRSARLSRTEYVEHEGFVTMLASRHGVRVPEVVTAGLAANGDALIAVRPDGSPLADEATVPSLTGEQLDELWDDLARLHGGGIVHHRIDLDRVVARDDGTVGFSDLSSASVAATDLDVLADRAQLVALGIATAGTVVATEHAGTALGRDGLVAMLPYLQEAAAGPLVRKVLREQDVDLDAVRTEVAGPDADEVELANIRRVTWKSLLSLVLFAVAANAVIGMVSDIDMDAFARALADANWWWLLAALLIGQLPRFANGVSTLGTTPQPLPYGPTVALQFATCYVNLAVPSAAGRLAITTRYMQRFGVTPVAALAASALDSGSDFVVQAVLFVAVFFVSDVDLELDLSTDQLSGLATTATIIVAVLVVAVAAAALVPSLRQRALDWVHQARNALQVLRQPRKLVEIFGGSLLSQVLFAVTLGAAVRAFGFDVPLSELILINTVVSLFAGILPVPGGIGVTEAGLSLGLTRVGIDSETALAIALCYRFATFYLPPIWGLASYRWMASKRYL